MPNPRSRGCLTNLLALVALIVVLIYAVAGITSPWAFHIGGRWTPLLYWQGRGTLVTKTGAYPLYVFFYPSSHMSRLHVDGLQPTGGVQGSAAICLPPGTTQSLNLTGTIFGGWRSTEGSLMEFRLLDWKIVDVGQRQGYFDLYGHWRGTELVMNDRDGFGGTFRSGLKMEQASVTFTSSSYSEFENACATEKNVSRP
jgi:hypothetical protein